MDPKINLGNEQNISGRRDVFFAPELLAREYIQETGTPRGRLLIAGCRSGSYLSSSVVACYRNFLGEAESDANVLYLDDIDDQFSDSETHVRLDLYVSGYDVFLFQALFNPRVSQSVDQNYMAFLIAARAFREHGANHVTAVLPYLAYARQDKPTMFMREPTTASLMADLAVEAGIDRLITWHPHSRQIHGFYGGIPLDVLTPLTLFIEAYQRFQGRDDVIVVAPDVGASKFVTYMGRALGVRSAIASKYRPSPEEAVISEIIGDFSDKRVAIVLDDMISGGGTIEATVKRLAEDNRIEEVYVGVSHNLCTDSARERLMDLYENYNLKELLVTDSIPQTQAFRALPFIVIKSLSEILARMVNRIHYSQSVSELFTRALSNLDKTSVVVPAPSATPADDGLSSREEV
jgi:ribose-phosphate pyrophosphokinase